MIEGKGVPGEPTAQTKRRRDALEGTAAISPSRQMKERSERALDERCLLFQTEVADIPFP